MPFVRLAGTIQGADDPNREIRARLLYLLFKDGWDIYNSNGDQRITLGNIEHKIIESDAFVFMPGATLEDLFKAVSIFVGYQTLDRNLDGKPTILLDSDRSWQGLLALIDHLHQLGTVMQNREEYLFGTDDPGAVSPMLAEAKERGVPVSRSLHPPLDDGAETDVPLQTRDKPEPEGNLGNVCVFCSATIADPAYQKDGYEFGRILAENQYGCVSGAGRSGIMGAVVKGAVEHGGWAGGSNVPHIIKLEGLPDGLSSFWLRPDIYTRMEVMIERSDAFVIFPGGTGTVQEMLALLIFKHQRIEGMEKKPIVIYNRRDEKTGLRFWDPMIKLLRPWSREGDFAVVNELDEILPALAERMPGA